MYLVALPMARILALDMQVGITGLWAGFACGYLPVIGLYIFFIFQIDTNAVVQEARMRRKSHQTTTDSDDNSSTTSKNSQIAEEIL